MKKSFYDFDFIIELNEKRLEQYNTEYNRVLDKYAIPIIIYSALAIYLVALVQHLVNRDFSRFYSFSFSAFCILLIASLIFYQSQPKEFYIQYRWNYESQHAAGIIQDNIDNLLKATYINELEAALANNEMIIIRKRSFYYKSLVFSLLSIIPYLFCLAYHFSKKDDNIQKVEFVNDKNFKFEIVNTEICQKKKNIADTSNPRLPKRQILLQK